MTTEEYVFWAMAALVGCSACVFVYRNRKASQASTRLLAAAPLVPPSAAEPDAATLFAGAMAAIERDGVRKAVGRMVDQFAESHARDYTTRVQGVVSPKDPTPPSAA